MVKIATFAKPQIVLCNLLNNPPSMEQPILLLKKDLIKPISQALERIEKIRERKANNEDSIILEGLFALALSSFENSLNDTLEYCL